MKAALPIYDICTLSDFKQDDILISRFAPYLKIHKNLYKAHKHNFYHLVFFTDGGGGHTIDFQNFTVKPGQIYFMVPGQVHSWRFEGPVDGYVINFSVAFFQSLLLKSDYLEQFSFFSGNVAEAVIDIPGAMQGKVSELFEQLVDESAARQPFTVDMVRALLLQLFILVDRLSFARPAQQLSPYNYTLLKNFQKLIEASFATLRLPKEYAELLYITPNHLNALCNDVLGMPAGEVIRNRVILEAKRLLVSTGSSISEIAYGLNFSDNSNFTKFFKKQTGLTPEEFKKTL